ncbi:hypothetical protein KP005_02485 [Geomonas nitrogeniifigens]|uniref:Zinc ribbon domain-containing protein n=1 Tax=Geomonas diazotrophica TaxID=2843197 RepID=A0ABX8JIG5_9BACT|nr:hypothetical protein [Geomonas nitrogeniifigens]QWV98180.1 hypothetical protein KP005_02485 [Geomonas nitrogeniifigens]
MPNVDDHMQYEERADYIQDTDLIKMTVNNTFFDEIQLKLIQKGAKLIVGPRGSGKTHQMKIAYNSCIKNNSNPMAVYVTFGKYYHLEPFLYKAPNAITIFHTWVLAKLVLAVGRFVNDYNPQSFESFYLSNRMDENELLEFVSEAEKGVLSDGNSRLIRKLTITNIISIINQACELAGRKRTILLLDDAALSLTPDYMIEFFDIFRSLKTVTISPKASVYPGTTQYGPRFHVSHDAEKVDCWLNVNDQDYGNFMDQIFKKRLGLSNEDISGEVVELLKYGSFGIPRAFITLVRSYLKIKSNNPQQRFNKVVDEQIELLRQEYLSLHKKLPQFKNIINLGLKAFEKIVEVTVETNRNVSKQKQLHFGILKKDDIRFERMIKFLIEAGMMYEITPPIHYGKDRAGKDRIYDRYIPHLLFVLRKYGGDFRNMVDFFSMSNKTPKHPIRRKFENLLGREISDIHLNLPACKKCSAERLTEEQKFCHQCGNALVGQSAFELCMEIPINDLPIPTWQKERITQQTSLKTLGDILSVPDPASELRKADMIGKKRSEQIYEIAKYLEEDFLA